MGSGDNVDNVPEVTGPVTLGWDGSLVSRGSAWVGVSGVVTE